MSLFKKKCQYCGTKIEKNKEVISNVKTPGFVGTKPKSFCSEEHINKYNKEVEAHLSKPQKAGGCCG